MEGCLVMTNWQTKKLGDIGRIAMCKRIMKDQTSAHGDIPFYKIGTFGKNPDAYISSELYENYKSKYSFPKIGEILISASGTIGRAVVYDGSPAYFQDSNIVWLAHDESVVLNKFLGYAYTRVNWQTDSGTIARLYNDNFRRVTIKVPEKPEQQRIVGVLEVWDEYIEKLEQKIALKEQLKKGLMQQLLAGKRRLPGFSGEWQKTRIGDISNVIAGGTPSTSRQEYWNGGNVLWMKSGEINKTYLYDTEHRITDLGLESSSAKILPMNSVLIALAGQGSTRGKVAINKVPLSTNQSVAAFIPTKRLHYGYLFWNLSTRYDELRSLSAGDGGRGGLNLFILKNLKIKLPEFNEQREICAVLDKCNEEINSLVNYKGLIHRQKKYLLKNLITGTIRTPEDLQPLDTSRLERSAL